MKKDILQYIKEDMREVRRCKKFVQEMLEIKFAKLEAHRKKAIAKNDGIADTETRDRLNQQIHIAYNQRRDKLINDIYDHSHNDQLYYLIYKDGSEETITAEEILGGAPFPKLSNIVYAEMFSTSEHMDTETGDLDWYSDENMEACNWDYAIEDARVQQYKEAIRAKFGIK